MLLAHTLIKTVSFNSATTLKSWMTSVEKAELAIMKALQFGHDPEVVDDEFVPRE